MTAALLAGAPSRAAPLSAWRKLAYGFGSIAYGVKDNGFSTFLLLFYNQVIGLPADMVGVAIMCALFVDAFVDPVIGVMSDNLKSRWGRRHPFMYAAALPVALSYLMLWHPPTGRGTGAILAWLFVSAVLVRTAISAYEVPSAALAPELTADYNERTSVLGYRYLFGWLGGMGMLLVTYAVFLAPAPGHPVGVLNPAGYHRYALAASVVMGISIVASALGTHALISTLPQRAPTHFPTLRETFAGMGQSLRNRAFLILMGAGLVGYINQGVHFTLVASYLNVFVWLFRPSWLFMFTGAVLLGVIIAFAITGPISRRYGKMRTAVVFGVLFIVLNAAPYVLRAAGWFYAPGDARLLPALMAFEVAQDAFSVGAAILGASMMSDVVEDDELRSGVRNEGLFFAGSFFMQKCATGMGTGVAGIILALAHFPIRALPGQVAPGVLDQLALLFVAVSAVLGAIGAAVMALFPLDEASHRERLAQIAERAAHIAPLPASEPELPALATPQAGAR